MYFCRFVVLAFLANYRNLLQQYYLFRYVFLFTYLYYCIFLILLRDLKSLNFQKIQRIPGYKTSFQFSDLFFSRNVILVWIKWSSKSVQTLCHVPRHGSCSVKPSPLLTLLWRELTVILMLRSCWGLPTALAQGQTFHWTPLGTDPMVPWPSDCFIFIIWQSTQYHITFRFWQQLHQIRHKVLGSFKNYDFFFFFF